MTKRKPRAIEFDPIACLKALPNDFWVEVPTWRERYGCEALRDYKRVPDLDRGRGYQKEVNIIPALAEEFPGYMEFWKHYISPGRFLDLCFVPIRGARTDKGQPEHDWVEVVIGKARRRYCHKPGWANDGIEYTHELFNGKWYQGRDVWRGSDDASLKLDYKARAKLKQDVLMDKKLGSTWNRLRKKALRAEGEELSAKDQKARDAKEKAAATTQAQMDTLLYVQDLIEDLQKYHSEVEAGTITRERVRKIFDNTNGLTAQNAKLKKAMGIR